MRWILAGLFILLGTGSVFAQTKGEVESIGFGGYYRPDCWTPMVVRIRPGTLEPGYYQIQIEQKDRDSDTQVFTRIIQVNASDAAREQRFWMYFLPQTVSKGLPDSFDGFGVRDLSAQLKVWLCNKDGKQLEPLPLTLSVKSVDKFLPYTQRPLSRKLILCISDGGDKPDFHEYSECFGVTEDILPVMLRPDELPESVLGYDGVDAVVWMSADADQLSRAGATRLPALTQFVKMGGKLIVTQPAERGKIEALDQLLPIEIKDTSGSWLLETRERQNLVPLKDWAKPVSKLFGATNPFATARGPFKVARVPMAKKGAFVVETIDWNADESGTSGDTKDQTPYLVRWGVGLGDVTWVAQNLGDLSMTRIIRNGWVGVWDKVLDLKDDVNAIPPNGPGPLNSEQITARDAYSGGGNADLGFSFFEAMNHSARGAGLVVLAIGFFIVYWAASGPISYFVLANKKKKGANWPIFAACALVATLLTVGVVKLVMGSSAAIHHISFVRWTPHQPAVVESRIGVYLTKSSVVSVNLPDTDAEQSSYVTAYNQHPALYESTEGYVGKQRYDVWVVKDKEDTTPTQLNVPFRSTLKKLQARWVGKMDGIEGLPKLTEKTDFKSTNQLSGKLVNSTGRNLRDVYVAYVEREPKERSDKSIYYESADRLIYVPAWNKDATLDLKEISAVKTFVKTFNATQGVAVPGENKIINDTIVMSRSEINWVAYWASLVRRDTGSPTGSKGLDSDHGYAVAFPLVSLYDRLPVIKKVGDTDRYDLKRLGARKFDMSQCVSAGELVILAQDAANTEDGHPNNSALPYPLEVDGDKVPGTGVTFYQFALPLNRVQPEPAATQPTSGPATEPAVEK